MDEYYPAEIQKLCQLTEDSFQPPDVRAMELYILKILDFEMYGAEPMTFIRRYLNAAQCLKNTVAFELSILFMDIMVLISPVGDTTAKKAAASVFSALIIKNCQMDNEDSSDNLSDIWTPNMRHYAWPSYQELLPLTKLMLKTLKKIKEDEKRDLSITMKYYSESRHHGLLNQVRHHEVDFALNYIDAL